MFCRSCGRQLNDDAVFCNGCGLQLKVPEGAGVTAPMPPIVGGGPIAATKRSNTGLIVALAIVGVLVVGAAVTAGLYFTGVFDTAGVAASRTDEGTASSDKKALGDTKAGGTDEGTDATDDTAALGDDASYDVIAEHYGKLSDLADQVGRANTDGTYGGTGFAYEVFNASIGSADLGVRKTLVEKCQALLDTVSGQKQTLDDASVSAAYRPQKETLLGLYGLLEKRMNAMLGAAEAAVDDPSESAWRPILSPASTDSREQFEAQYPNAEPVRQ
ncbi:MAG: zinc ribbon domain-containing protein [Actinobacteria bacterium]|nr:MAG: zinc ribbon domain-containing protein [Actinomycetota bacterium]